MNASGDRDQRDGTSRGIARTFDEELRVMVLRELTHNEWTRHTPIEVEARDGTVTLRGIVPSCAIRDAAERIAHQAPCVRAIINALVVEPPGSCGCDAPLTSPDAAPSP